MRTTTVRELKHETGKVLWWVARGETVEVRRRCVPVARKFTIDSNSFAATG